MKLPVKKMQHLNFFSMRISSENSQTRNFSIHSFEPEIIYTTMRIKSEALRQMIKPEKSHLAIWLDIIDGRVTSLELQEKFQLKMKPGGGGVAGSAIARARREMVQQFETSFSTLR